MAFSEHLLGLCVDHDARDLAERQSAARLQRGVLPLVSVCARCRRISSTYTIARRHDCAFLAGLAFGFAPYRMAQFAHVQVLSAYWMPLALAGLHRYFQDRRRRWLVLFAGGVADAGAGVRLLPVLPVGAHRALAALVPRRTRALAGAAARRARVGRGRRCCWRPVLYGYWTYQRAYGLRRGPDEIVVVQRRRRQRAQGVRQSPALGLARRRRSPGVGAVPGHDAYPAHHRGWPSAGAARRRNRSAGSGSPRVLVARRPGLRGRRRVAVVLRSVEDRDRGAAPAVGGHAAQAAVDCAAAASPSPACCTRRSGPRGAGARR